MRSTAVAAGLAAALALVPMAAPGASAADGTRLEARMTKACQRVPPAIERTRKLQQRLGAEAGTRGSLAWLAARQARAAANDKDDRAQLLASRLEFRRELAGILPDRLTWLQQAQARCDRKAANPSGGASS
jgi:hypothetical protein